MRYIGSILATMPPVMILGLGSTIYRPTSQAGQDVNGRPKPLVFIIVWTVLTILWSCAGFIATFQFKMKSYIMFHIFSFMTMIFCVLWLRYYKLGNKAESAQILLICTLCAMLTMSVCNSSNTTNHFSNMLTSICITPLSTWLIGATIFNYLEINRSKL